MRIASRALGAGLRRLLRATVPEFAAHRSRVGRASPRTTRSCSASAAPWPERRPADAARAAALAVVTTPATAAIRLLGLDPYAVHALLARLAPEIDALSLAFGATTAIRCDAPKAEELPAEPAIALDLLADVHLHQEVRLFAS